jgi:hypothetical protein
MIIKNIEQKIKLGLIVSIGSFLTALIIAGSALYFARDLIIKVVNKSMCWMGMYRFWFVKPVWM